MKLEVGMYVRTKRDGIGKIISLSIGEEDDCCFIELSKRRTGIKEHNILKASNNIIDLIEVRDIIKFEYDGTEYVCDVYAYKGDEEDLAVACENISIHIKENNSRFELISIVTKEQFESMEYKVGE